MLFSESAPPTAIPNVAGDEQHRAVDAVLRTTGLEVSEAQIRANERAEVAMRRIQRSDRRFGAVDSNRRVLDISCRRACVRCQCNGQNRCHDCSAACAHVCPREV